MGGAGHGTGSHSVGWPWPVSNGGGSTAAGGGGSSAASKRW